VIPPNEIGVKFDQIGVFQNVKVVMELVMFFLQRLELFSKGYLTRVYATSLCRPSL
jgi:hypothetical protein